MALENKRGAIELSMTTIIIIIVGVVLLSLGLSWVKNSFSKVNELSNDAFLTADSVIQNEMAPSDTFYLSGYSIEAKQGKFTKIYSGVQFFGQANESALFTLGVSGGEEDGLKWVVPKQGVSVKAGERKGLPFGVTVPKNVAKGTTYSVTVTAYKNGQPYESESFLLEVV
jgi:hypothetical protein